VPQTACRSGLMLCSGVSSWAAASRSGRPTAGREGKPRLARCSTSRGPQSEGKRRVLRPRGSGGRRPRVGAERAPQDSSVPEWSWRRGATSSSAELVDEGPGSCASRTAVRHSPVRAGVTVLRGRPSPWCGARRRRTGTICYYGDPAPRFEMEAGRAPAFTCGNARIEART